MPKEHRSPATFKKKNDLEILRSQLSIERSSFLSHWKMLGDYILPTRPRFNVTDRNRGDRKNNMIIDSTATLAVRTLRSGMMGGVTSPARPWFKLTTEDPALAEFGPVKDWLYLVRDQMSNIFLKSNVYNSLPLIYGDIGVFATAAMLIEEDFKDVIHTAPQPIGSYYLALDNKGRVCTFVREFSMTVRQLVMDFGQKSYGGDLLWDNFSAHVRSLWDAGEMDTWIDVVHVIKPNQEYDPNKLDSKFKKYLSFYYETGTSGGNQTYPFGDGERDYKYLRESGYDYFPFLCPRWEVTGNDVYGTDCPGMTSLGDVKALQIMHRKKAQAIEKNINPPLTGPSSLKNQKVSILPGDITYADERDGMKGLRPTHEVKINIADILNDIERHQYRISRAFYEDLFLMLSTSDRRQITAREIDERHEEKLLALGPVLEQLNQDLLDPLIDNTFNIMVRQGMIPEPPPELQGMDLKVEYISIMAQAQKMIGISSIERFSAFVGSVVAQTQNPELLDKVDSDQLIDEYGDAVGISPLIVRSDEEVAAIREQRAKAAKARAMMESLQTVTQAGKDLSQMDMSKDTALTRLTQQSQAGSLVPTT